MKEEPHDPLIYVLRPDNTALYLPESICRRLKVRRADKLTADQMSLPIVADLIEKRLGKEKGKKKSGTFARDNEE